MTGRLESPGISRRRIGQRPHHQPEAVAERRCGLRQRGRGVLAGQVTGGKYVAGRHHRGGAQPSSGDRLHPGDPAVLHEQPGRAVPERHPPTVGLQPAAEGGGQPAGTAHGMTGWDVVQQGDPADHRRRARLGHRRPGLRAEPGQRGLEPFTGEPAVEQCVPGPEEVDGQFAARRARPPAGRCAQGPERAEQSAGARPPAEGGDDRSAARLPYRDEFPIGVGVPLAAGLGDRRTRRLEIDGEDERPAVRARVAWERRGRETPGVAVDVAQAVGTEIQFLHDAAVPDDHVRARAAVDAHSRPALDRGDRTAEDVVGLDHLDRQTRTGEVAGGHQPVVAGADHDGVGRVGPAVGPGLGAHSGQVPAAPELRGTRGSCAPRMANGRVSPGKW